MIKQTVDNEQSSNNNGKIPSTRWAKRFSSRADGWSVF